MPADMPADSASDTTPDLTARDPERYIATVKLGPKSQIVIPKEVREIFNLVPGDNLLLLADSAQGIALVNPADYTDVVAAAFDAAAPRAGGAAAPGTTAHSRTPGTSVPGSDARS